MKKLYKEQRWIKQNERRRRKAERRSRSAKSKRRGGSGRSYKDAGSRWVDKLEEVSIQVGPDLDPMGLGTRDVAVWTQIRRRVEAADAHIYVDLSEVEHFTLAGVILLWAGIRSRERWRRQSIRIRGNMPADAAVASDFAASGFFNDFEVTGGQLPTTQAKWTSARRKKVVAEKAAELVDFAAANVTLRGDQKRAMWQNLVECMMNTTNHAAGLTASSSGTNGGVAGMEEWIAGVRCQDGVAQFAFVDMGVGICQSAKAETFLRRAGVSLGVFGQSRLVKEAFEGTLASSTGSKGRGLGLPRMRRDAKTGLLEALQIRTGKVWGVIDTMRFQETNDSFEGTVLTWQASGNEDEGEGR